MELLGLYELHGPRIPWEFRSQSKHPDTCNRSAVAAAVVDGGFAVLVGSLALSSLCPSWCW